MIDISTTNAEKVAFSIEQAVRKLSGIENVKSSEAELIRALAADRDRLRFNHLGKADALVSDDVVKYVLSQSMRCRDCDEQKPGTCPGSGLPCDGHAKAIRFVLDVIRQGIKSGNLDL